MAYPPRQDTPGALLHVMNRGKARRPVFEDEFDLRFFLSRLVREIRGERLRLVSYSLLTTHFHFLIQSPRGQVGEGMRRLQSSYTRFFNRRRGRDGALFRGRYLAKLVDSDAYFRALVRYIDANPVAAGMVEHAAEHPWGSAAAHLQGCQPRWLDTLELEAFIERKLDCSDFRAGYAELFGGAPTAMQSDWIERRLRANPRGRGLTELDGLLAGAPDHVREWLEGRAVLADGAMLPAPAASPLAVAESLARHRAEGVNLDVRTKGGRQDAWFSLHVGLLRSTCCVSWVETAGRAGRSVPASKRAFELHVRLLENHSEYGIAAGEIAQESLRASCGVGKHPVGSEDVRFEVAS